MSGRPIHILLVEDNPGDARLTLEAFREARAPSRLSHVVNGVQALEFLRRVGIHAEAARPDLILLDLVMPRVNGLEALRWIKAEHPEIKVIIVTVHSEDAYRQAAEASGADAFLLKKTLGTMLLPTIRRLCGSLARQGCTTAACV